jgi:predicted solute-binding protein
LIFAYRKEFATEPLAAALARRGWDPMATDDPAAELVAGSADVALTPVLDYGRAAGVVDYALVPGISITTRGFAGLIKLVFNKGLVGFTSIAVKEPASSETLVARMVLAEKHDIEPKLVKVPAEATIEEMLAVADCALAVGDDAIFRTGGFTSLLDLTDEWGDAVEAPLPYMIAWGHVGTLTPERLADFTSARDEAVLTFADRVAMHPESAAANAFYQRYLRGEIDYALGNGEVAALEAFYRYAFYYSAIVDIPAIKFLPDGAPADLPARG